jgi:hypothetical protein
LPRPLPPLRSPRALRSLAARWGELDAPVLWLAMSSTPVLGGELIVPVLGGELGRLVLGGGAPSKTGGRLVAVQGDSTVLRRSPK